MSPLICCEIETESEREAIYRLRYDVYVREMGRRQRHADSQMGLLAEPLDRTAIHLAAFEESSPRLLGALRIHLATRRDLAEFPQVYREVTAEETEPFALVTRLVTRSDMRGGSESPGLVLARAAYQRVLGEGVSVAYIDCHVSLESFFDWLGFDSVHRLEHSDFGSIVVMRIDLNDLERLERTQSPLREVREAMLERVAAPIPEPPRQASG